MRLLADFFTDISDPRRPQGRRHPMPVVLAIATGATLCGMRGYKAISDWAQSLGSKARERFGCRCENGRRVVPSESVIRDVLVRVDPVAFDQALQRWNQAHGAGDERLAIDIQGKDITADALLTQRSFADYLVEERQAHYHFTVKANQPNLLRDIALYFEQRQEPDFVVGPSLEHGRVETRKIWTTSALNDYLDIAVRAWSSTICACRETPAQPLPGDSRENKFALPPSTSPLPFHSPSFFFLLPSNFFLQTSNFKLQT